jgi:hypothetical protein
VCSKLLPAVLFVPMNQLQTSKELI